jgi:hypothetical protein
MIMEYFFIGRVKKLRRMKRMSIKELQDSITILMFVNVESCMPNPNATA